ncbi:MAG: DUF4384 domain-containing protein [Bacteroidales bacterium]|nr:MAG: DUF4384 domain-containing protein [Bacteroidales bacterium]
MKVYKLSLLCIAVFLLSSKNTDAQVPQWADENSRKLKFPDSEWIVSYASEQNRSKEEPSALQAKLIDFASTNLIQSIQTTITAISTANTIEMDNKIHQTFQQASTSASNLKVTGLKNESAYDAKSKTGFAIVYAKRSELSKYYNEVVKRNLTQITEKIAIIMKMVDSNSRDEALRLISECQTLFREAEEAQTLLVAINKTASDDLVKYTDYSKLRGELDQQSSKIRKAENLTIDEAASIIAAELVSQKDKFVAPIKLSYFTFQETGMNSPFSRRMQIALEQKLVASGVNIDNSVNTNQASSSKGTLISGTYWEEGNSVRVVCLARSIETGKPVGSTEAKLSAEKLAQTNLQIKPENFQDAYANMRVFSKGEIEGGDLNVEIWTNKGSNNLIFTEGEHMKLSVRANKECYLRVIYHLADGQKVLLLDNYYISTDKVNKVYELPYEFECSEPFGVETLQLNAQELAFGGLRTQNQDGYEFIVDDMQTILVGTRGMKKVTKNELKAERRVTITTMRN